MEELVKRKQKAEWSEGSKRWWAGGYQTTKNAVGKEPSQSVLLNHTSLSKSNNIHLA